MRPNVIREHFLQKEPHLGLSSCMLSRFLKDSDGRTGPNSAFMTGTSFLLGILRKRFWKRDFSFERSWKIGARGRSGAFGAQRGFDGYIDTQRPRGFFLICPNRSETWLSNFISGSLRLFSLRCHLLLMPPLWMTSPTSTPAASPSMIPIILIMIVSLVVSELVKSEI